MEDSVLRNQLKDLIKDIGGIIPPARTNQDYLNYLRVCIKYQGFDLEATRREKEVLEKILKLGNF